MKIRQITIAALIIVMAGLAVTGAAYALAGTNTGIGAETRSGGFEGREGRERPGGHHHGEFSVGKGTVHLFLNTAIIGLVIAGVTYGGRFMERKKEPRKGRSTQTFDLPSDDVDDVDDVDDDDAPINPEKMVV